MQQQQLLQQHTSSPEPQPSTDLIRQVFISHTGQDKAARDFAASVLKPSLESAGLQVFIDYRDLQPGDPWPERLVQAACCSAVMVVVLSKSYSERFWCMLELDLAMHGSSQHPRASNPLIIPVFYDEPDSVVQVAAIKQHWAGQLSAMHKQQQEKQQQQQQQQLLPSVQLPPERQALVNAERWAGNISDMKEQLQNIRLSTVPESAKDREWQLAMRVVVRAVPQVFTPVYVEDALFGCEEQLSVLLCKVKADRLGVWIHGIGGSGKTTLAKLLFNRLAPSFKHRAFISLDPGDGSQQAQSHLSGALAALGALNINQQLPAEQLLQQLRDYVCDKAVLLVIDNVWTAEQLDGLLPPRLHPGSTLVITSRRDSLDASCRYKDLCDANKLFHHPAVFVDDVAARTLFRHWSNAPGPLPHDLARLEQDILKACGGLPLALKVAGAQLARQPDPGRWQEVLHALTHAATLPDADEDAKLKGPLVTSFNTLSEAAQNMLLDVVSVLHNTNLQVALAIWQKWWPQQAQGALEELQRRALISIVKHEVTPIWHLRPAVFQDVHVTVEQRVQVHDIIMSLARGILRGSVAVKCEGRHTSFVGSRVWVDGQRDLVKFPKGALGPLVGAMLTSAEDPTGAWWELVKRDQVELRILVAQSLHFGRSLDCCRAPPTILWRRLLALVDLIPRQVAPPFKADQLSSLQYLDLSGCSWYSVAGCSLPASIGQLQGLQQLILRDCQIWFLPRSIGRLCCLQRLDLEGNPLRCLPASFGQLTSLQVLALTWCVQLRCLPASFGHLSALQQLNLSWCDQLRCLPASLGHLSALQQLNLSWCPQLRCLPYTFGQLSALQQLNLSWCPQLRCLPYTFGQLSALEQLDLSGCDQLRCLPASFGQLSALQQLHLSLCDQLSCLPDTFWQLQALTLLDLGFCEQLSSLPQGPLMVASIVQLSSLRRLSLMGWNQLTSLPNSIERLSVLEELDLRECSLLRSLPDSLGQLSALKQIKVAYCDQLDYEALPDSVQALCDNEY